MGIRNPNSKSEQNENMKSSYSYTIQNNITNSWKKIIGNELERYFFYQDIRDFLLSSGLKNHREHRVHREKRQRSVLSVYSVVDFPSMNHFSRIK